MLHNPQRHTAWVDYQLSLANTFPHTKYINDTYLSTVTASVMYIEAQKATADIGYRIYT